jgi:hypothetical protein
VGSRPTIIDVSLVAAIDDVKHHARLNPVGIVADSARVVAIDVLPDSAVLESDGRERIAGLNDVWLGGQFLCGGAAHKEKAEQKKYGCY